ncbi:MAG: DUF2235 domain-containing protein, partial [Pseudomonadota bacterium]
AAGHLARTAQQPDQPMPSSRPSRTHIFIVDGTLSRLTDGEETNAGLLYRLLTEVGPTVDQTFGYHPGVQGEGWLKWLRIAAGQGINAAICQGYATLASRYEPGDKVMLLGYSRGAYAVRSIAGWIGRVGLLKRELATERRIARSFRHYQKMRPNGATRSFTARFCHADVPIEMVGVWDTVRALGLPYPVLNRIVPMVTEFHDHRIGDTVARAFQALAIDETRVAYQPVKWSPGADWPGQMEQVWFPGAHADVGGHVHANPAARGLSNIPLVWMLERVEACGVNLPPGWRDRFPTDPLAPAIGNWRGGARLFFFRNRRIVEQAPYESVHPSVDVRIDGRRYRPKAEISGQVRDVSVATS